MFSLTTLICLIWVILLCCILFLRWEVSSLSERSFLFIFLGIDTLTVIMLPTLLLAKFRTWLDGARLLLLLVCHISIAVSFAVSNPTTSCPDEKPDDRGVCQLLNVFIIVASWVPPFLLILYGTGLVIYAWRSASRPRKSISADEELEVQRGPQSDPITEPGSSMGTAELLSSVPSSSPRDWRRESGRKSRLEKRLPEHFF